MENEIYFKNASIIITDPCYIIKYNDWDFNLDYKKLGFTNFIVNNTYLGDWSCEVYDEKTADVLGKFCSDAGLVGVFDYYEAIKYNKKGVEELLNKSPWCITKIDNFTGKVYFDITTNKSGYKELLVIGRGNINFKTEPKF